MTKLFRKNGVKTGFTLIELLVVIAIIGILASIVLASLNTATKKSRDARRVADLNQLRLAEELYFDSAGGKYSADLAALTTGCGGSCIAVVPVAPLPGSYTYCTLGTSPDFTSYTVHATLELAGDKPTSAITAGSCTTPPTCNGATDYCVGP
ncbi:MAG: type II secretion system protein [bacterium]|nr:type II secretion system protein [bacterium]